MTFLMIRSALAGGLLAFALSFDEIVVTTFTAGNFQTLPQWILNNTFRQERRRGRRRRHPGDPHLGDPGLDAQRVGDGAVH